MLKTIRKHKNNMEIKRMRKDTLSQILITGKLMWLLISDDVNFRKKSRWKKY